MRQVPAVLCGALVPVGPCLSLLVTLKQKPAGLETFLQELAFGVVADCRMIARASAALGF